MRPWKSRAIDHVVCVSNAVASGNHIPPGPNSSVIPNFVLDDIVLGGAGDVAEGQAKDIPAGLPKEEFLLFVGELSREKGYRHCYAPTSRSATDVRHCCWSADACRIHLHTFPTVLRYTLSGHTITLWPRFAVAFLPCFHRFALMPVRQPYWRRWLVAVQWSRLQPAE